MCHWIWDVGAHPVTFDTIFRRSCPVLLLPPSEECDLGMWATLQRLFVQWDDLNGWIFFVKTLKLWQLVITHNYFYKGSVLLHVAIVKWTMSAAFNCALIMPWILPIMLRSHAPKAHWLCSVFLLVVFDVVLNTKSWSFCTIMFLFLSPSLCRLSLVSHTSLVSLMSVSSLSLPFSLLLPPPPPPSLRPSPFPPSLPCQSSREQLAVAEFAQALLTIPKTLAVNAAQDSTELVAKLRAFHNSSQTMPEREALKWWVIGPACSYRKPSLYIRSVSRYTGCQVSHLTDLQLSLTAYML